jgi:hypothetical protein
MEGFARQYPNEMIAHLGGLTPAHNLQFHLGIESYRHMTFNAVVRALITELDTHPALGHVMAFLAPL